MVIAITIAGTTPASVGVLRRRSRIIVERTKSIRGAIAVVNAIIEVPARDCGLDGRDIRELPRIQVKERIGKPMWRTSFLVRQRHDPGNDWARETRSAEAIFVIFHHSPVARLKSLRLTNNISGLGVNDRGYVRNSTVEEAAAQRAGARRGHSSPRPLGRLRLVADDTTPSRVL